MGVHYIGNMLGTWGGHYMGVTRVTVVVVRCSMHNSHVVVIMLGS